MITPAPTESGLSSLSSTFQPPTDSRSQWIFQSFADIMSPHHLHNSPSSEEDDDVTEPVDERKPRIPYVKGWCFTAQQHIPPPPIKLSRSKGCTVETIEDSKKMKEVDPWELCLQHPPLPGVDGSSSLELKIHDTIRIGDHHNAQVVVTEVLTANPSVKGLSQGQHVVAKLYDPMYIDDDGFYINPFVVADKAYTWETAAYAALPDLHGSAIPHYYGSYSVDIPLGPKSTENKRSVRLILVEWISGSSMQQIDPASARYSEKACQNIMKSIVEFETLVYSRDIFLRDLHPRNVMFADRGLVFIDFADADIGMGAVHAKNDYKLFKSNITPYVSPLVRWHESRRQHSDFGDWADWDWQPWLQAEFAHTAELVTPKMIYTYTSPGFARETGNNEAEALRRVLGY